MPFYNIVLSSVQCVLGPSCSCEVLGPKQLQGRDWRPLLCLGVSLPKSPTDSEFHPAKAPLHCLMHSTLGPQRHCLCFLRQHSLFSKATCGRSLLPRTLWSFARTSQPSFKIVRSYYGHITDVTMAPNLEPFFKQYGPKPSVPSRSLNRCATGLIIPSRILLSVCIWH